MAARFLRILTGDVVVQRRFTNRPVNRPLNLFFLLSDMEAQSLEAGARVCANRHDARHVSHQRGRPEGERRHVMLAPQRHLRHPHTSPDLASPRMRLKHPTWLGSHSVSIAAHKKFKSGFSQPRLDKTYPGLELLAESESSRNRKRHIIPPSQQPHIYMYIYPRDTI